MFEALGAKIVCYYLFCLLLIKLSTTDGSANVEVSPKFSKSFEAIFLKIRLIIFPDLVFGNPAVICIKSGVAIGPIFSLIVFFKSNTKFSEETTPTLRET